MKIFVPYVLVSWINYLEYEEACQIECRFLFGKNIGFKAGK